MTTAPSSSKSDLWPFPAVDGLNGSYSEAEDTLRGVETSQSTCPCSRATGNRPTIWHSDAAVYPYGETGAYHCRPQPLQRLPAPPIPATETVNRESQRFGQRSPRWPTPGWYPQFWHLTMPPLTSCIGEEHPGHRALVSAIMVILSFYGLGQEQTS
jgi:hypothetical protein